ncbi:DUF3800 domain-containing protein [Streptomyces hirsutus]|uniref:DUF3800 domain-containing protein n=1 Tax=Streptomyces hirsutus TaxID=35620 RepID=UPI0033F99260
MTATNDVPGPLRVFHMDDSGDSRTMTVFAALGIPYTQLDVAVEIWTGFRKELAADAHLRIPTDAPLHSQELAGGRGRAAFQSRSSGRDTHLLRCREVIRRGLMMTSQLPDRTVHAAYRFTDDYRRDRPALFTAFLAQLNTKLAADDEYGIVIVDGNGTESALRTAVRRLPAADRRICELQFISARDSHLLQAADMLAYSTFQDLAKREERRFMWGWSAPAFRADAGPREL